MTAPYEIRGGGDGKSKKQSMAELKLRRLNELNIRLKEDLDRRRIPVSEAANECVYLLPRPSSIQVFHTPQVDVHFSCQEQYRIQGGLLTCCLVL